MKEIRIILTSVGGLVAPGIIKSLKRAALQNGERLFIIGTDMRGDSVGFHFVDKCYVVPRGDSEEYNSVLLEIAENNNIDVIVPCSDEELLSVSKEREKFIKKGITPICSHWETVYRANDKGLMLKFLKDKNIPVPDFYLPLNIKDVEKAAEELGYPFNPVVVKPRLARGGRGFKILEEEVDLLKSNSLKLEYIIDILKNYEKFPEIVVMEYLPGEEYSVDALAYNGAPLYIIPRKRIRALGGPSIVGEIVQNNEVKEMVDRIIRAFGFHLNVNIQLKYSRRGLPLVYEINPRVSGTIVANEAAGVNLLYFGIKLAMGKEIPKQTSIRRVKMLRYFEEVFIYEEELKSVKRKLFT